LWFNVEVADGKSKPALVPDVTNGCKRPALNGMTEAISAKPLSRARSAEIFTSGSPVGASGLYLVFHSAHQLPNEVILIEGELFPRCARCNGAVIFELRKAAHAFSWTPYSGVRLHELPVREFDGLADHFLSSREFRIRRQRRAEARLRERSLRDQNVTTSRQLRTASRQLCQAARELVARGRSLCNGRSCLHVFETRAQNGSAIHSPKRP